MNVVVMTIAYTLIRLCSFYFQPTTPLNASPHLLNTALTVTIVLATIYLLVKKNILGWYIVAGEIILGGSGAFLQAFGVTLRTLLLFTSLTIYFWHERTNIFRFNKNNLIPALLIAIAVIGLARGLFFTNARAMVISDFIPYLFILYYFPLRDLLANDAWKNWCFTALQAAIFGQAIFIVFAYIGLTSGQFQLQDAFYHWYRDVAGGKITLISYDFYRLVLNEQLLLVPALLVFIYRALNNKLRTGAPIILALLFLLSLNLTRIYLVALAVGILVLFRHANWKRWLAALLGVPLIFFAIFSMLFLISSGGRSFGLEVFGLRIQSIVAPNLEESSLSRMLLLPKILAQIQEHPVLGRGLGSTISVFSPIAKDIITTPHYDWGYLEILVELGAVGLCIWLIFLYQIVKKISALGGWQIASLVSLLIINITSPALFHVFGFILLGFLLARSSSVSAELSAEPPHTPSQP